MPKKSDQLTEYARLLKEQGRYPLPPRTPWDKRTSKGGAILGRERPVATPYLVIPNQPGEPATRPLDPAHARHSAAIEVIDNITNKAVTALETGKSYELRCQVFNAGAVDCFSGIAEFYVASPAIFDALAAGNMGVRPAPLGYTPVVVPAFKGATVACQKPWIVSDPSESILVRIYDPLLDRPEQPYDFVDDRHVARRDALPDFNGTYQGMESANKIHGTPTQIRIVVQQTYTQATVAIHSQVSGGIPAVPQEQGQALVLGSSFVFNFTETLNNNPFTTNVWNLNMSNPNTLHFTHHRHYLQPGDSRPDTNTNGDLPRA